ncbi:hydantoinase/oxoprolinase family protein [Salinarimonas soli]|uniref:H4MPT-linked C1 transfer pathway protein n=1 Tax=Salinarimonas soli TaxID=1638099 RepID=A0A5B2VFY5_9HYPH|nr:hydantoinase/oxoprolinase family protein [Salinarimonas soli]KAA2237506.1 H4MPT-linked C1 transfer pathway protein [Salinarimonas soli]
MSHDSHAAVVGWDLGGVHVKAARVEGGRVRAFVQAPCALWQGVDALDETLAGLPDWARGRALHAVTMTGELCDCFADRREGVGALTAWAVERLPGRVLVYGGRSGFLDPAAARAAATEVASANWHASAVLAARLVPDALLVDIGSTTADLIPLAGGRSVAAGYTDAERLETGELVYTGLVRTPVMALAHAAPFRGGLVRLAAEHFATTADLYRLLGALPDAADQQEAADGRGKSLPETRTRLARMIGRDRDEGSDEDWRRLAAYLAERQLRRLHDAAAQVLSRGVVPEGAPVIGCGVGLPLAEALAGRLGRPFLDLAALVEADDRAWLSACAPAMAVALLAAG